MAKMLRGGKQKKMFSLSYKAIIQFCNILLLTVNINKSDTNQFPNWWKLWKSSLCCVDTDSVLCNNIHFCIYLLSNNVCII